jgi:hypothetical protein
LSERERRTARQLRLRAPSQLHFDCFCCPFSTRTETSEGTYYVALVNWYFSLFKNIPIHEKEDFQIRAEVFNLFTRRSARI